MLRVNDFNAFLQMYQCVSANEYASVIFAQDECEKVLLIFVNSTSFLQLHFTLFYLLVSAQSRSLESLLYLKAREFHLSYHPQTLQATYNEFSLLFLPY